MEKVKRFPVAVAGGRDEERTRTVRHEVSLRTVFTIIGIVVAVWLLARVWQSLLIFTVALVLAGTFSPVVTAMERRGIPRGAALGVVLLGLLGTVVGLAVLIVPVFAVQITELVAAAPALQGQIAGFVRVLPFGDRYAETIRTFDPNTLLAPVGASAFEVVGKIAETLVYGVMVVVLAFYLIADHERVQGFLFALLPRGFHLRVARVLLDMETVVGGYMRGQVITSVCIGLFTLAACTLAGVQNALAVAVFAAFADLIPFVGPVLAITPPVLLALVHSPGAAIFVFIALMVYSQFETHLLVPRIYGQSLRLSPIAVVMALLMGGQVLGIMGAILALPLAAGIRVLVEDLRINLPGEIAGEPAIRAAEEEAEAAFATQVEGASSVESAVIATAVAEQLQADSAAETGVVEIPIEEQGDPPPKTIPYGNPART